MQDELHNSLSNKLKYFLKNDKDNEAVKFDFATFKDLKAIYAMIMSKYLFKDCQKTWFYCQRIESKFSRPSPLEVPSFNFPSTITYTCSPSSPSLKRIPPLEIFTESIEARSDADCASSSAVNRGARLTTSSSCGTWVVYSHGPR